MCSEEVQRRCQTFGRTGFAMCKGFPRTHPPESGGPFPPAMRRKLRMNPTQSILSPVRDRGANALNRRRRAVDAQARSLLASSRHGVLRRSGERSGDSRSLASGAGAPTSGRRCDGRGTLKKPPLPPDPPSVEPELAEDGAGVRADSRSCTREARLRALEERSLKCTACNSYEVVPKKGRAGHYICAACGKVDAFSGWVRIHRR